MPLYGFGAGALWGTPLTDANGNAIANPSPLLFGVLQNVSVDISADIKELYGQNQFAEAVARGKAKISCKAQFGRINGKLLNDLFFGQTLVSSIVADYYDTTGSVIPATPFQITPTIPSSGTWSRDLGVRDQNGNPMTRVASAPATGQYSVATGIYTFAAADTGLTVFISFAYTATGAAAKNSTVLNIAMGNAPSFRCDLSDGYSGGQTALSLFKCISTKLSFATKQDDFLIPEMDFSAFANPAGQVLQWGTSE
jgi:hypothetical protein